MAVTRPSYLTTSQWLQVRAMRGGIWFLTIQTAVVIGGCCTYFVGIAIVDRRTRNRIRTTSHPRRT